MTSQGRIRISLATGELEVEGSTDFLSQYEDSIQSMLRRLDTREVATPVSGPSPVPAVPSSAQPKTAARTEEFGEVLASLPDRTSGTDHMLVAGWFVQRSHADSTFSTGDASKLLLGQGVRLANPSQSLKNNIVGKKVFKVGSRYRVSRAGEEHLRTLLGAL